MSDCDFSDGRYVAILGDSGSARDVPEIVDWLSGEKFRGDVGEVIVPKSMGGKFVANYREECPPESFSEFFDEKALFLWSLAKDWSDAHSGAKGAWACPRIVVADITRALRFGGRLNRVGFAEKYEGFSLYFGKDWTK